MSAEAYSTTRVYYSLQHIFSAALFTRASSKIENDYKNISNFQITEALQMEHRAYIIGAIITSISFLEASINELFVDTVELNNIGGCFIEQLDSDTRNLMAESWRSEESKTAHYPTLEKFQEALTLAKKQTFPKGKSTYQNVKILIALRNTLVHYKPITTKISIKKDDEFKTFDALKSKFQVNPLVMLGSPFFPDKCLGYGCAKWAVNSSIKFVEEFYSKMELNSPLVYFKQRLEM